MRVAWSGILTIGAAMLAAAPAVAAGSRSAPGWNWDAPPATAAPQPLAAPRLHCDPEPGVKLPPECARQAAPETGSLEDALKPPAVQGPSGNNRAKKAAQ